MLKVDFHTHTHYSPDSITSIRDFILAARKRGLDKVVVTDHNLLKGALEAQAAEPDLVIVGEEVQTSEGEFLAAYVTQLVPRGLQPHEALQRLKDQGAFISISHPFDPQRSGWSLKTLEMIVPYVDAIETLNGRMLRNEYNEEAKAFADTLDIPGNAGTDAHHPSEIGRVYTLLPDFWDAESLRQVIRQGKNMGIISSPFVHFYSSWARIVKAFRNRES